MFEGMSTSRYRHRSGQRGPHQVTLALQLHVALPETTQQAPRKLHISHNHLRSSWIILDHLGSSWIPGAGLAGHSQSFLSGAVAHPRCQGVRSGDQNPLGFPTGHPVTLVEALPPLEAW